MKQSTTVLRRICIVFFALVIPWSVLSSCLLYSSNKRIEETTEQMVYQNRKNVLVNLEEQLTNTYTAAILSDTFERAVYLSTRNNYLTEYERAQAVDQIFESLTLINIMGEFVINTRVYVQPMHTVYSNEGSRYGSVQSLSDLDFNRLTEKTQDTVSLSTDDGKLRLLIRNAKSSPSSILDLELSSYSISKYLKEAVEFSNNSQFILQFPNSDVTIQNGINTELLEAAMKAKDQKVENELIEFSFQRVEYYAYVYHSKLFSFDYYEIFEKSMMLQPLQQSVHLTFVFAAFSILVMILFFYESYKLIHRPLQNLTNSFAALRQGDFSVRARSPETADFLYLYNGFNQMADELQTLISQNYQQKVLLQKAELRQLQAQINPHFLYNSFFLLQRVISSGDTDQAEEIAQKLGQYFRYITKQNSETVLLADEVEHARMYADIQAIRFSKRIKVSFELLPEHFSNIQVPKLFLQPLIENAFKYGLENKVSGAILRVSYQVVTPDLLIIRIEDNGDELTDAQLERLSQQIAAVESRKPSDEMSGMLNIARRLQIYYQSNDCFQLERSDFGGLGITLYLRRN